jgi:hypothetical protein
MSYAASVSLLVAMLGVITLQQQHLPIGPMVLGLTIIPLAVLLFAKRSLLGAVPDLLFRAADTGLLTIPALWRGTLFGVTGAVAAGVIGDVSTD